MKSLELLFQKREELEARVRELNPRQVAIELTIYDAIIQTKQDYFHREQEAIQRIIDRSHEKKRGTVDESDLDMATSLKQFKKDFGHQPAFILVLNYRPQRHENAIHPSTGYFQNGAIINEGDEDAYIRRCIGQTLPKAQQELYKIAREDSAILLSPSGKIVATNVELKYDLITGQTRKDVHDLNITLGLLGGGHTRQHASLDASGIMGPIYTLGEESEGYIRRFEKRKVTFSTHTGEDEEAKRRLHL